MKDYEQLYYDAMYENKALKNRITELENEIQDLNRYRNGKNINLQKYLISQLKRYRKE